MYQKISEPINVTISSRGGMHSLNIETIVWKNRAYPIRKIGLHHMYREGKKLFHVFSLVTPTLFMKIRLDTETLGWTLEEIGNAI